MTSRPELADRFRTLHESGTFVMPNPWDRGSARILAEAGFPALATTSAGFGRSIGKDDQEVTRGELLGHVAELTEVLDIPVNVDSERLFSTDKGGITETVRMLADAGAAGCSIEDYDPSTHAIDSIDVAASAVAEAAAACTDCGLVLTARAENHLYGITDLAETIERLHRYAAAGAHVLYAPGLTAPNDIARVVDQVSLPVNVLALSAAPTISQMHDLGVRRISLGSMLFNAAYGKLREAVAELLGPSTSGYAR